MLKERSRGITFFFTGLSGAGKSTIAEALTARIQCELERAVTVLDGDVVRTHLSSGLGFSKADRNKNIERIAFVAAEVTKHGGIVVCAAIAPYDSARQTARSMVEQHGRFVEVYVSTPLSVCEQRDPKGLYAKVRAGEIKSFTGVDDPYEAPSSPDVVLDASQLTVDASVDALIDCIVLDQNESELCATAALLFDEPV